ncbi:MAG: ATP-binding protein [Euryarchaeota archaeon]|nr:ATP-binding protein [Euryarchaeota archaeon]
MSVVSGPATGKDFFDREDEVKAVVKSLRKDNILLVAPRRYGKTSVMREVERKLTERGYLCLYLDVMHVHSPKDFVFWLAIAAFDTSPEARGSFLENMKSSFVRLGERLQEVEVSTSGFKATFVEDVKEEISEDNWSSKGRDIFNAIKHLSEKNCICIIVDELSECINNVKKRDEETAREFLQWLRSTRQTMFEDLKFIVGGSVSFTGIVRNFRSLAWINDLKPINISGFSEEVALKFIKKAFKDSGWEYEEEIGLKILECVGEPYIPYFISIFLSMIFEDERWLSEKDIEELYNSKLLGAHGRGYFDYYKQRLGIYYGGVLARAAEDILREACLAEQGYQKALAFDLFRRATGIEDEEKFMNLLYDLENDFYITFDGEHIRFQSKVLRDWWRLYNV